MNWEAIGAMGELISGIAVIATLFYLARQIRQNNKINASAVRQSFYDTVARQMIHGTDNSEFHAMLERASMTDQELTSAERLQLFRFLQAVFVGYQCAFVQYRHNALSEEDWNTFRALLRTFWHLPGKEVALVWEQFKLSRMLDEDFEAEVERLRDEAQPHIAEMKDTGIALGQSQ